MSRKPFFLESKLEYFEYSTCDKCGLKIKEVQDGKGFWNPNPKAQDRNICRNCYEVWQHKIEEKRRLWQEKYIALKNPQEEAPMPKPDFLEAKP